MNDQIRAARLLLISLVAMFVGVAADVAWVFWLNAVIFWVLAVPAAVRSLRAPEAGDHR